MIDKILDLNDAAYRINFRPPEEWHVSKAFFLLLLIYTSE